ncbi:alpha-glucosidase [Streptomyces javensis]|uniref:alpha-glucosidase n=1 Tax=Streptomyces javensis TaxID=114698 RepID=UPI0033E4C243
MADLPREALEDPTWERSGGRVKGRDGCRVPLPWTWSGPSFGFGAEGSWLPQPEYFGELSAEAQSGVAGSTLELYREALRLRRALGGDEGVEWVGSVEELSAGVLHFRRSTGWHSLSKLSAVPVPLPEGLEVVLASEPLDGGGCRRGPRSGCVERLR